MIAVVVGRINTMALTSEQLQQYFDDGFLIVDRFFSDAELQPVIDSIDEKVNVLAEKLYASGKIRDRFESDGFLTRLTKLNQAFPGAATLIHTSGILPQSFADLWSGAKLLDIIEQMLGPEISGHPVWNLRAKTPHNPLATVPWHQDAAYLAAGSESTFQPTAWIPFVDANTVNGCMQLVRGGHKNAPATLPKVFQHHLENTRGHKDSWYLYIDEYEIHEDRIVTCNVNKGSVLFLNNLIPHRSTENYSDSIRWSIDLRWQRPSEISGMEGIKDCILMRTASDSEYKPDWAEWSRQSRQVGLRDVLSDALQQQQSVISEEDAIVSGPWMERWQTATTTSGS